MTLRALAAFAFAATAALVFNIFPGELNAQAPPALFGDSAIDVAGAACGSSAPSNQVLVTVP
jgi:hypothetical protein